MGATTTGATANAGSRAAATIAACESASFFLSAAIFGVAIL